MIRTSPSARPRVDLIVAALALAAVVGWGLVYVPSSWLMESWPPLLAAGARVGIAGAVLVGVLAALRRPWRPGCPWWVVGVLALTQSVILYGASNIGIKYGGAGLTSVLQNTDPIFVAVLAVLVLGEVLTRGQWLGIGLGILGAIVIAWEGPLWPPELSPLSLLVIGGAIAWAVGTVAVARHIGGGGRPVAIAGWQMLLGGPILVALSYLFEGGPTAAGGREVGLVLFIALVGSALPFACFYIALGRSDASTVSAWFLLVPVVGVFTAWPMLGEAPTPELWVGMVLVCVGLWLVFRNVAAGSVVAPEVLPAGVATGSLEGVGHGGDRITDADRQWASALTAALDDRHITPDEAAALEAVAVRLGLSHDRIAWLGGMFIADHVAHALDDGVVSPDEERDLLAVARLLGVHEDLVHGLIAAGAREASGLAVSEVVPGTQVHFTLPLICTIGGRPIDLAQASALARDRGLEVVRWPGRSCALLVAADAEVLGPLARWRKRRGARLMVERSFWRAIGVSTD